MSQKLSVILIFDIGRTNKKLLLFNEQYKIVYEENRQLQEIKDEDGFVCENVHALTDWILNRTNNIINDDRFEIKAINLTAYGASFVYLDKYLKVVTPLYNYLKPFPPVLHEKFYQEYGGESQFSKITASPVLGNLNSGMQLYRLKYERPDVFNKIKYALHLPQFLSFVLTSALKTEITSVGCHTNLWDFRQNTYHQWVYKEKIIDKLPLITSGNSIVGYFNRFIPAGTGLHDSSSALIPYLYSFNEPFILLSTGTWCISLNPFNHSMLEDDELMRDCLCYLSHEGKPVKASRLFSGHEHEKQVKILAEYYNKPYDYYIGLECNSEYLKQIKLDDFNEMHDISKVNDTIRQSGFSKRNLSRFRNYSEAYHQLIADIVKEQVISTNLVLKDTSVKRILVDGGFSQNQIYMYLLAAAFPAMEVYAASVPQATALGAALVFHNHWNSKSLPASLIDMKLYSVTHNTSSSSS